MIGWPSAKEGKKSGERAWQTVKLGQEQSAIKREEKMSGIDK